MESSVALPSSRGLTKVGGWWWKEMMVQSLILDIRGWFAAKKQIQKRFDEF